MTGEVAELLDIGMKMVLPRPQSVLHHPIGPSEEDSIIGRRFQACGVDDTEIGIRWEYSIEAKSKFF